MCGSAALEPVIDLGPMPVTRVRRTPDPAADVRHPMAAVLCPRCGLLQLADPMPPEDLYVEGDAETTAHQVQDNIPDEISTILNFTDARSALEIACNHGGFLDALRRAGVERVVGIEPSRRASALAAAAGFTVHPELFDAAAADRIAAAHGRFETIVARQLLEHIGDLDGFFDAIERVIENRGFVFFEIPAVREPLLMGDLSVLWEEHVNYFVPETVRALLHHQGYEVVAERVYNRGGGSHLVVGRRTGRGRRPGDAWPDMAG
ncbi:MAG TPA: methyltransferase domain-containing protein, partial [Azospirillum sp.]